MYFAQSDIVILVPVYQASIEDLHKFFNQIFCCQEIPDIYFVYEENSCEFDFEKLVSQICFRMNLKFEILTLSGKKGIGFALNAGVMNISKPFIMRHDIGDDFFPNRIENTLRELNENLHTDIIYSQAVIVSGRVERMSNYPSEVSKISKKFLTGSPICHPTVVFRRQAIIDLGNYDPSVRFCEDLDLWLRAYKKKLKFRCIDKPTIRYYSHSRVRKISHWQSNLNVRLKNFGSPTVLISSLGIILILGFIMIPKNLKNFIYQYLK